MDAIKLFNYKGKQYQIFIDDDQDYPDYIIFDGVVCRITTESMLAKNAGTLYQLQVYNDMGLGYLLIAAQCELWLDSRNGSKN